jgi:hypothetical protein
MAGIFGAGIIPGAPQPGAYLALVAFFGGDRDRADAWLAGQLAYTGDATTAEDLLAALERSGDPASVELKLGSLLSTDISALDVSPPGSLVAGEDGFTSTLDSSYVFTVI